MVGAGVRRVLYRGKALAGDVIVRHENALHVLVHEQTKQFVRLGVVALGVLVYHVEQLVNCRTGIVIRRLQRFPRLFMMLSNTICCFLNKFVIYATNAHQTRIVFFVKSNVHCPFL